MDLGVLLESLRAVSPLLHWGHARALSSRSVAAVSRFPSRGSRDQGLSLEAFPRGFPRDSLNRGHGYDRRWKHVHYIFVVNYV